MVEVTRVIQDENYPAIIGLINTQDTSLVFSLRTLDNKEAKDKAKEIARFFNVTLEYQ